MCACDFSAVLSNLLWSHLAVVTFGGSFLAFNIVGTAIIAFTSLLLASVVANRRVPASTSQQLLGIAGEAQPLCHSPLRAHEGTQEAPN
jgi:hypothetical protein